MNGLLIAIIILNSIECSSGKNKLPQTDTAKTTSGLDSMPIVKPRVKDSGSIIITPPVNDSNVMKPATGNNDK